MATRRRLTRTLLAALALVLSATWWQAPAPVAAAPLPQSAPCAVAAAAALGKRGAPYVWGEKGPVAFDCSGLTSWAWAQAGYSIGPSTYDQATRGVAIPCRLSDLDGASTTCWQPGDLIFLRYTGGQHVAMYIDNGLFADAYNTATGVIIHNVAADSFYQAHFWQARRIVDCGDGLSIGSTTADPLPNLPPSIEEIPDILGSVVFNTPQCSECSTDGSTILLENEWSGSWPQGFEALNLPLVFQTVISWLAWQIQEIIRQLICWLLTMLQLLANILAAALNTMIYGVNSLFKMLVLLWLSFRAYFYAFWELFEDVRRLLAALGEGLAGLAELGRLIGSVGALLIALLGRLIVMLGELAIAIMGVVGWLGGIVLGLFVSLQLGLASTTMPAQLAETHVIYRATRGTLEGVRDSRIGWLFPVLWGMAYVAFVTWLARFLSASKETA